MLRLPVYHPSLHEWKDPQYIVQLVKRHVANIGAFQLVPPPEVEASHNRLADAVSHVQQRPSVVNDTSSHFVEVSYPKKDKLGPLVPLVRYFENAVSAPPALQAHEVFEEARRFRTESDGANLLYADQVQLPKHKVSDLYKLVPRALHPKSQHDLCRWIPNELEGLTTPFGFIGVWGTGTGWHDEDDGSASVHVIVKGRKLWYFIPRSQRPKLDDLLAKDRLSVSSRLAFVSPVYLVEQGIDVYYADHSLSQGSIIVSVGALHQVINIEPCIGYAWNLYFESLLPHVLELAQERRQHPKRHSAMKIPIQELVYTALGNNELLRSVYETLVNEELAHRKAFDKQFPTCPVIADAPSRAFDPWNPGTCARCENATLSWSFVIVKEHDKRTPRRTCLACALHPNFEQGAGVLKCHYIRTGFTLRQQLSTHSSPDDGGGIPRLFCGVPTSDLLAWTFYSVLTGGSTVDRTRLVNASRNRLAKLYHWTEKEYEAWFQWLAEQGFGHVGFTATRLMQFTKDLKPKVHDHVFTEHRMSWTRVMELAQAERPPTTSGSKKRRLNPAK